MSVTAELVKAILDTLGGDVDIPTCLATRLEQLGKLQNTIQKIRDEERAARLRHTAEIVEIQQRLQSAYKHCPHYVTVHHSDPSGGSDSYRECTWCGAEI